MPRSPTPLRPVRRSGVVTARGGVTSRLMKLPFQQQIETKLHTFYALTRGRPVTDLDAGSPLSKAFMQLAAKLGGTSESDGSTNGVTAVTAPGSRIGRILRIGRKN